VIGEDKKECIPIDFTYMAANIQHPSQNVQFNFASYLAKHIHQGLVNIKENKEPIRFRWFSLLCHMFLFYGRKEMVWHPKLRVNHDDNRGNMLPVQGWTHIWDRHDPNLSYRFFRDYFVVIILRHFQPDIPRILEPLLNFLRPTVRIPPLDIKHNWGDCIPHEEGTVFRVYGTPVGPHFLPKYVPLRVGFLEIIW